MEFSKSLIAVCEENELKNSFKSDNLGPYLFHFMDLILFL